MDKAKVRTGGRASRVAARQATVQEINPCPPGQIGGAYKPLSDHDLKQIVDTAFRILSDIGMSQIPPEFQVKALAAGAHLNELGRLCYPRAFVEDIINQAPKMIPMYGRDLKHDFEVGGDKVYFGTGGAAVQTLDMDSGLYRASTLQDLYDFTRLADKLDNISWFTRCCVATDVPDNRDLDVNTVYALLAGTTKPVGTSFFVGEHVDPAVQMFDMALGGEGKFKKRPFCKAHISPIISPLRYGEDALDVAEAAIKHGMSINAIIAAQSGATAPATLAGMLAMTTAETLAALIMVNILSPGHPMIFSNWPFVVDLRTGSFCGGGGEISILNAAAAQIGNHFGLPTGVAASMADAKAVDAQMGMEKALASLAAGLAGANMVYESSGMMASLLGVSFEAFVADDEMLSHIYRMIRGVEVNEETLGFDAILGAVTGDGHFLGGDHTMAAMQRDFYYPKLADRDQPTVWAENGAEDMWAKSKRRAKEILANHKPEYIDRATDAKIRDQFNILLKV